jgi:hypothetical protein
METKQNVHMEVSLEKGEFFAVARIPITPGRPCSVHFLEFEFSPYKRAGAVQTSVSRGKGLVERPSQT